VTRLIGLYREIELSPGRHRSNDAMLLEQVGRRLRSDGFDVALMTLADAAARDVEDTAALVFSMCQGPAALESLTAWERRGTPIVNSPRAAVNTYRDRLSDLMQNAGIPFPATTLVATTPGQHRGLEHATAGPAVNGGLWLKRGDVHASVQADVQRVGSAAQLQAALAEFASRGIGRAALQPHASGDEVKFYGVSGGFFHWFRTGGSGDCPVDADAVRRLAEAAAAAVGLDIFGGDIIVAPDGGLTLIDLNDWPSFAPCRDAAAGAIADFIVRRLDGVWNRGFVSSADSRAV
jgi:hypothetical protein